jgi:hypothetical protein
LNVLAITLFLWILVNTDFIHRVFGTGPGYARRIGLITQLLSIRFILTLCIGNLTSIPGLLSFSVLSFIFISPSISTSIHSLSYSMQSLSYSMCPPSTPTSTSCSLSIILAFSYACIGLSKRSELYDAMSSATSLAQLFSFFIPVPHWIIFS